jgi:hypothetical protein
MVINAETAQNDSGPGSKLMAIGLTNVSALSRLTASPPACRKRPGPVELTKRQSALFAPAVP